MEVPFQVTSHEGYVIVSCAISATSFELGLIQPHRDLDVVQDNGSLIYSKADALVKQKYKKSVPVSKLSDNVHSRGMQPPPMSRVQETEVNQCMKEKVPIQEEIQKQRCKANVYDNNCQFNNEAVCADKKCQATKCYKKVAKNCQITNMQQLKSEMDMQSKEPAMQSSFKKKHISLCKDKNCQSTWCYGKKSPVRPVYSNDKNCQEIPNVQMRPKKPLSLMQSVTKISVMWLPKPAMEQSTYKLNKDNKNCQSPKSSKYPVRPVCGDDKNCPSTQCMWPKKPTRYMQSLSRTDRQ